MKENTPRHPRRVTRVVCHTSFHLSPCFSPLVQIFNLKFMVKQLNRAASKCDKESTTERSKIKKAITQGNLEGAKIYSANVINKKTQALNFLRLASQLDAVVTQLESQAKMNLVNQSMKNVVGNLGKLLKSTPLEKVQTNMDKFEKLFETLNVQTNVVTKAFDGQMALSTPMEDVEGLMRQVAEEHQLELDLPELNKQQAGGVQEQQTTTNDDLGARLAALQGR